MPSKSPIRSRLTVLPEKPRMLRTLGVTVAGAEPDFSMATRHPKSKSLAQTDHSTLAGTLLATNIWAVFVSRLRFRHRHEGVVYNVPQTCRWTDDDKCRRKADCNYFSSLVSSRTDRMIVQHLDCGDRFVKRKVVTRADLPVLNIKSSCLYPSIFTLRSTSMLRHNPRASYAKLKWNKLTLLIMAEEKPIDASPQLTELDRAAPDATQKSRWERIWPTLACGAGLFSDGYLQSAIGPVNTVLGLRYGDAYKNSSAQQNVSSIAFAGTVVGQLFFGYTSDHYSRKWSLLASTIILFVFAALSAGAYGAGGTPGALFAALTAYRFLLGIGIGQFSVFSCVRVARDKYTTDWHSRRRISCGWTLALYLVRPSAITIRKHDFDLISFQGNLLPMIIAAGAPNNLGLIWRLSLGLGVVFPLSLIYFRFKLQEPESVSRNNFRKVRTPYWLALKFYGPRLFLHLLDHLDQRDSAEQRTLADLWLGYPHQLLLLARSDYWSFRLRLDWTTKGACHLRHRSGLCRLYHVWLVCNAPGVQREKQLIMFHAATGPGDNIGLIASKTSAAGIRGQYYAVAAAFGKIGGLVGSYVFPVIENDGGGPDTVLGGQLPFYVASALCFVSAFLVWLLPEITQDTIAIEDLRFKEYLVAHGFDVGKMGGEEWQERRASVIEGTQKQDL
nr:putative metabolite transport protein [Quercus suber]